MLRHHARQGICVPMRTVRSTGKKYLPIPDLQEGLSCTPSELDRTGSVVPSSSSYLGTEPLFERGLRQVQATASLKQFFRTIATESTE